MADWQPISLIAADARAAFAMRAESGRIPTKARSLVEFVWDRDQLSTAIGNIAIETERHLNAARAFTVRETFALCRLLKPDVGETAEELFFAAIKGATHRVPSSSELRTLKDIYDLYVLKVDIIEEISADRLIPFHKWAPALLERIDWERSEHLWRADCVNSKGQKLGYDIEGIEFDRDAAIRIGFVEADKSVDLKAMHVSRTVEPPKRWTEEEMTSAIREYCDRTLSGDCDLAWRNEFKARESETGWTNTNFREHWSEARKTRGAPGRQSSALHKAAKQSAP